MPDKVLKTKKISKDEAMELRKDHLKSIGNSTAVIKAAKGKTSANSETRSARFIMSTETVDRYMDIVVQAGLSTERFMENPQALMFHNSRSWPIGLWEDVQKVLSGRPRRTEGTLKFLEEGIEPDADRAFRHVMAGTLRAVSIGFIPDWNEIEMILDEDDHWTGGLKYAKSELVECSLVPIPAQPDALIKDAGGDMKLAKEFIEDILDNWAKDPATGLLVSRKDYEGAYRVVRAKAFDDLVVKEVKVDVGSTIIAEGSIVTDRVSVEEPSEVKDNPEAEVSEQRVVEQSVEETDAALTIKAAESDQEITIAANTITAPTISIGVDTKSLDEASEKVTAFSSLIDGVAAKISKIFGRSVEQERIEPKVDTPPSPEAIQAAVSRVKAARERIASKGLI